VKNSATCVFKTGDWTSCQDKPGVISAQLFEAEVRNLIVSFIFDKKDLIHTVKSKLVEFSISEKFRKFLKISSTFGD